MWTFFFFLNRDLHIGHIPIRLDHNGTVCLDTSEQTVFFHLNMISGQFNTHRMCFLKKTLFLFEMSLMRITLTWI